MNTENFDYLKDQVKFTGFGDGLENRLKEKILEGQPTFVLQHAAEYGSDKVDAWLHFRRSEEKDMYFFNKYDMALKRGDGGTEHKQTFFVGKNNTFTFKEAYNLLDGRAVNKDLVNRAGEKYNTWVKLDFNDAEANGNFRMKHFHENYGYNVEAALAKHPIKELEDGTQKERLIESLKKGNRQSVTVLHGGQEQKRFIHADPRYKAVKVTDDGGREVRQAAKMSEKQEAPAARKRAALKAEGATPEKKKKQTRKRGPRVS